MPGTDLLVASSVPFGTDAGVGALSEPPGLYLTNDPLELGLDLDRSISLALPWNNQSGITWQNLDGPGNTMSTRTQGDQQKPHKFEKPCNAEKEPRTQMIQTSLRHCRNTANATIPDFQTEFSQREQFLKRNRLAAKRCRRKKKTQTQYFETRFREEAQKKKQLEGDITALRGEILDLKDEILKYALCDDGRVGQYLAHMMQQITQGNTAGTSSLSVSESLSALSSVSASLVRVTSPTATAAGLSDELLLRVSYVDEEISGDINGETASHGSDASYPSVDGTATELVDAYTQLA